MINPLVVCKVCMLSMASLLVACSSEPQVQYKVLTYQTISHALMAQADRKRQLEQFKAALLLYQEAESYAQKRNDKLTMGISRLKRAAIHIEQKQSEQALALINQVEKMNRFDAVDLANPLMFIRAKLAHSGGDTDTAVALLSQLEQAYIEQPEQNIYYRLVRWVYQPSSVRLQAIQQDVAKLESLVETHELANIEIYSYGVYQYAKWLAGQGDVLAQAAITKAIEHFSRLELTNKISDCYQLGADYYQLIGETDKAVYFQQQVDELL